MKAGSARSMGSRGVFRSSVRRIASAAALVGSMLSGHALADSYDDETDTAPTDPDPVPGDDEKEQPLGAGGLDAPGALPETTGRHSKIEKELDRADREDSGRGLEFAWLNGEIGFLAADLTAISGPLVEGGARASGSGPAFGGALGLRFLYFTLGARFRAATLGAFDLWSLVGEGGMKIPLGKLEPYATLGAGVASASNVAGVSGGDPVVLSALGFDLRGTLGADYYLSRTFSLGAQTGGDFLFLSRNGSTPTAAAGNDGAVGAAFFATAQIGLHF